jgi:hypothetical protein
MVKVALWVRLETTLAVSDFRVSKPVVGPSPPAPPPATAPPSAPTPNVAVIARDTELFVLVTQTEPSPRTVSFRIPRKSRATAVPGCSRRAWPGVGAPFQFHGLAAGREKARRNAPNSGPRRRKPLLLEPQRAGSSRRAAPEYRPSGPQLICRAHRHPAPDSPSSIKGIHTPGRPLVKRSRRGDALRGDQRYCNPNLQRSRR